MTEDEFIDYMRTQVRLFHEELAHLQGTVEAMSGGVNQKHVRLDTRMNDVFTELRETRHMAMAAIGGIQRLDRRIDRIEDAQ